ncbi:MAG: zinc-dependent alcohol dehydrogenase [Rickettsiales bacterium]
MKAVVFHGIGDIRVDEVPEPKLKDSQDAIIRLTASAICGTDLHMVRGTLAGMKSGTILGHEGVGVIEQLGDGVRNFHVGDRVVIPSTIACGYCAYCRDGYFAQCDIANPNGKAAGTAFFGGPKPSGSFDGMQAEKVRVPFANVGLVKIPDHVTDEQAILLSDIFPTGYFGADMADIKPGHIIAVYGCGPVGLFAIMSAQLLGAGRIFAIDRIPDRLAKARQLGAEVINFDEEDPVKAILKLTGEIGVDRVIDAVGVDAEHPEHGMAHMKAKVTGKERKLEKEIKKIAPKQNPDGDLWQPGKAPTQALEWAIDSVAKAGTISIIGVYPETAESFPIGKAMNKNLTLRMGNCNHRKYILKLMELVASGAIDPTVVLTKQRPLASAIEAFEAFDQREEGWVKVELEPRAA